MEITANYCSDIVVSKWNTMWEGNSSNDVAIAMSVVTVVVLVVVIGMGKLLTHRKTINKEDILLDNTDNTVENGKKEEIISSEPKPCRFPLESSIDQSCLQVLQLPRKFYGFGLVLVNYPLENTQSPCIARVKISGFKNFRSDSSGKKFSSFAEANGLRIGDVIAGVNGYASDSCDELVEMLLSSCDGKATSVTLYIPERGPLVLSPVDSPSPPPPSTNKRRLSLAIGKAIGLGSLSSGSGDAGSPRTIQRALSKSASSTSSF